MKQDCNLEPYVSFIKEAEGLKSTLRTAWTAKGRRESTAEHTWRLALFAGVLCREFPELDREKVLMMCLVHDLGEIYEGDVAAVLNPDAGEKAGQERRDMNRVTGYLAGSGDDRGADRGAGAELMGLWEEYNCGKTAEALFVKAIDKAETIIQHSQGDNPHRFDYEFNLEYGKEYFSEDNRLTQLRRLVDEETRQRMDRTGRNTRCITK